MKAERIPYGEANEICMLASSYGRLDRLVELHYRMERAEWLRLVGAHLDCCDDLWRGFRFLKSALGIVGPIPEMMEPEECGAYGALPAKVTVYRGASWINRRGMSWSLDPAVAQRFPTLDRYHTQSTPMLYTATVPKNRILAVKLQRNESEVITFSAKIIAEKVLDVVTE